jgi:hypothetical protein
MLEGIERGCIVIQWYNVHAFVLYNNIKVYTDWFIQVFSRDI